MKWEYEVADIEHTGGSLMKNVINGFADKGWRVVCIKEDRWLIMEREIPESPTTPTFQDPTDPWDGSKKKS